MDNQKFLVLDLETDSLDVEKANIKWVGLFDGKTKTIIKYNELNKINIIKIINQYDKILTYNGNNFDIPILKRHKLLLDKDFNNGTYLYKGIDIYEIIKKRATLLFPEGFKSLSLNSVCQKLFKTENLNKYKINYDIFKKEILTKNETKEIKKYISQDLLLTWKIWEFLIDKFKPFAEFISPHDIKKLYHIKASSATFGYKAICYKSGIEEKWGKSNEQQDKFMGGYVMQPIKEKVIGKILYLDFASLYPMIYVHNNLFSSNCDCCIKEEKWHGNNKWKLNGYYCVKKQGKIENVIKEFFLLRKEYKKNKDSREQAIKIILNSLYGSSSRPEFIQIYSQTTASDCTLLGQQIIKYSIDKIKQNNMGTVLMSDTDSIILELNTKKNKEECLNFINLLSKEISNSFPFPWEEFNLKLENELKYIQFFKKETNEFKKKNYLYVTNTDELVIRGLDIIQRDCSELSIIIFNKYLKEEIIKNLNCKFNKKFIETLIKKELNANFLLLAKKFSIKEKYKSDTSIYNSILKKYGSGEHLLIKNLIVGVGKKIKYCSLEEAKKLSFNQLDLSDIWKEMEPFIDIQLNKSLLEF